MIDKKKITIFGIVAAVVVAVIVAAVIWTFNNADSGNSVDPTTDATASATPTETSASPTEASASPSEKDFEGIMSFDQDAEKLAGNAALNAAEWSSPITDAARKQRYLGADFSKDLAASFEPVWQDIYDPQKVSFFEVTAKVNRVFLSDVSGEEKSHSYRVGVLLDYDAKWALKSGGETGKPETSATWWVTLDEKTGKVTKIDQPTKGELDISLSK